MDATTAMLASGVPLHDRVGDRGGPACRLPAGYHPINALSIRPRGSIQVASLVVTGVLIRRLGRSAVRHDRLRRSLWTAFL